MRIIVRLNGSNEIIPLANQSLLNSYIHKCLGNNNEYHDTKSNYCISSLYGGKLTEDKQGFDFSSGGYFVVTSNDVNFMNKLLFGIMNNPNLFMGITTNKFDTINEKFYDGWNHFSTLSPFIIKKYVDKSTYSFATINDVDFENTVETHLKNKLSKILDKKVELKVLINKHPSHKVKGVMVKNCINKANQCQVSIQCNKDVAELIYNLGLGQSTGSGFGTIYKTENNKFYRN